MKEENVFQFLQENVELHTCGNANLLKKKANLEDKRGVSITYFEGLSFFQKLELIIMNKNIIINWSSSISMKCIGLMQPSNYWCDIFAPYHYLEVSIKSKGILEENEEKVSLKEHHDQRLEVATSLPLLRDNCYKDLVSLELMKRFQVENCGTKIYQTTMGEFVIYNPLPIVMKKEEEHDYSYYLKVKYHSKMTNEVHIFIGFKEENKHSYEILNLPWVQMDMLISPTISKLKIYVSGKENEIEKCDITTSSTFNLIICILEQVFYKNSSYLHGEENYEHRGKRFTIFGETKFQRVRIG